MSKTKKTIKHLFCQAVAIFLTGFIFAIGATLGISFFLRLSRML